MLDEWTKSLLTNTDILGLLKESRRGTQINRSDSQAVWKNKDRETQDVCVALFNLSDTDGTVSVGLTELGETYTADTKLSLLELWDKEKYESKDGMISAQVPAHGVKVFKVCD